MKRVGVFAMALGAIGMMAGVLGASVPFSLPWEDVGAAFMAIAFAVSVATFIVSMNVLRAGLDAAQEREGGVLRLAATGRSLALLALAIGAVVAVHLARAGAARAVLPIAVAGLAAVGAIAAGRALGRVQARSDRASQ
jgi:hypothetical protein